MGARLLLRVGGVLVVLWLALVTGMVALGSTRTITPISFVRLEPRPTLFALDPHNRVAVPVFASGRLGTIMTHAWSPDGTKLAVLTQGWSTLVTVRDASGDAWTFDTPEQAHRNGVHWNADSTQLVMLHGRSYTRVDVASRQLDRVVLAGNLFAEVDFFVPLTPTTALIRGQSTLREPTLYYTLNLVTGDLSEPPPLPCRGNPNGYNARATAMGEWRAVYICVREGGVLLADGDAAPRVLHGPLLFDDIRYFRGGVWLSPDTSQVLFVRDSANAVQTGRAGIYVQDVRAGVEQQVWHGATVAQVQWAGLP
jgi:hypothetical protein